MIENKRFRGAQKHEPHPEDDTLRDFDQNADMEPPEPYGLTRPARRNTEATEESEGQNPPRTPE
ncbi:hypothetical protein [Limoniibacter endophyticus]|uniref:Uncharacterized protein n=1 Tax=Limoniibacter endophyticus TaxID=1565040 RepID=A0A8J3DGL6_9HYPH|nr:hypothetical protein [Limoniibacter endophyticus]GHC65276.1 hypothetical protein GCM10010136_07890 [Limoniibacter endophyticus]